MDVGSCCGHREQWKGPAPSREGFCPPEGTCTVLLPRGRTCSVPSAAIPWVQGCLGAGFGAARGAVLPCVLLVDVAPVAPQKKFQCGRCCALPLSAAGLVGTDSVVNTAVAQQKENSLLWKGESISSSPRSTIRAPTPYEAAFPPAVIFCWGWEGCSISAL